MIHYSPKSTYTISQFPVILRTITRHFWCQTIYFQKWTKMDVHVQNAGSVMHLKRHAKKHKSICKQRNGYVKEEERQRKKNLHF